MKTRVLVLLLALGLIVAACGGSDESDSGVATLETGDTVAAVEQSDVDADEEVDAEQAMMALAACLRDEGLDIQDPTVDADGNVRFGGLRGGGGEDAAAAVDRETMRTAMNACQEQLEGVALGFGGRDFDITELQDTLVEYAACMRDNGYDMPDPDFSSFGPGSGEPGEGGRGPFGAVDFDDPDFLSAQQACEDVLGGLRAPGSGARQGGAGG